MTTTVPGDPGRTQEQILQVHVLGPLSVQIGGTTKNPGGPMPRALLARLLIARGVTVAAETLIDDLWQGTPPASASSTLHSYISTLRRALEPAHGTGDPVVLIRRGTGYAVDMTRFGLDADAFAAEAHRVAELLAGADPAGALTVADQALHRWRGDAYADVAAWQFPQAEAARLQALRAGVRDDRLAAMIELGRYESAAAELTVLTRSDPLRERAWELLALAQYRAGRQGEALATLDRARRVLADELGADPGPGLAALHQAVLGQDPSLLAVSPHTAPVRRRRFVPQPITSFLGRDDDLAALDELLKSHRLVTVTGPGGIGKTRVAIAATATRPDDDGPWFVEFAGLTDQNSLIEAVVRVVGLTAAGGLAALISVLRDRELILVLDNCEQAREPVAALCSALLTACPGIAILATSRVRLGVAGERVYPLAPLDAGAELFYERAALAPPDTDRDRVRQLCASLDNLPLAIELAAARTAVLSVSQLGDMLDQRFALLADSARTADPAGARHASMQAAIDGSYVALTDSERALFDDLSVFAGSFDLDAAIAVTGHTTALDDLAALVDRSMVAVIGGDPRRYRLLVTLREYGRDRLTPQRAQELSAAHLAWIRGLVAQADDHMRGPGCLTWTRALDEQMPDVHAALAAVVDTDPNAYTEIAGHLYWFWYRRGYVDEGLRHLAPFAERDLVSDPAPVADRIRVTIGRCLIGYLAGDLAVLLDSLQRLETLFERAVFDDDCADDRRAKADAAVTLGFFQAGAGAVDTGRERAELGIRLGRAENYDPTCAEAQMALGMAAFRAGEHDDAHALLAAAVELAQACGYDWLTASALWLSAKNHLATGDLDAARVDLSRMLDACERAFDLTSWMVGVLTTAWLAHERGDHESAARLAGVVQVRTDLTGFDPEKMDIIELASFAARMRSDTDPEQWESGMRAGALLERDEIDTLLAEVLG